MNDSIKDSNISPSLGSPDSYPVLISSILDHEDIYKGLEITLVNACRVALNEEVGKIVIISSAASSITIGQILRKHFPGDGWRVFDNCCKSSSGNEVVVIKSSDDFPVPTVNQICIVDGLRNIQSKNPYNSPVDEVKEMIKWVGEKKECGVKFIFIADTYVEMHIHIPKSRPQLKRVVLGDYRMRVMCKTFAFTSEVEGFPWEASTTEGLKLTRTLPMLLTEVQS